MAVRLESDVRNDITDLLAGAGMSCEISGNLCLLVSRFRAAVDGAPDVLTQAGVPFSEVRSGYLVSAYDINQLARKGWQAPQAKP